MSPLTTISADRVRSYWLDRFDDERLTGDDSRKQIKGT